MSVWKDYNLYIMSIGIDNTVSYETNFPPYTFVCTETHQTLVVTEKYGKSKYGVSMRWWYFCDYRTFSRMNRKKYVKNFSLRIKRFNEKLIGHLTGWCNSWDKWKNMDIKSLFLRFIE